MNDNNMFPSNTLPRYDLRETAFRRYEALIAEACRGSFTYDPFIMGIKPRTFVARFRDAILGYKRYGYESFVIPKDFNLDSITCVELTDGRVHIRRMVFDNQPSYKTCPTDESVIALMTSIAKREIVDLPVLVSYQSPDERDRILATAKLHPEIDCHVRDHNGKLNFYTV